MILFLHEENQVFTNFFICFQASFARYMSSQGFDTWILEFRGAGLSGQITSKELEESANALLDQMKHDADATDGAYTVEPQSRSVSVASEKSVMSAEVEDPAKIQTAWDKSKLASRLTETFMRLSQSLSGMLNDGQSKIMSAKLFDQISKLLEDSNLLERFNEIRTKLLSLLERRPNSSIASQIRELSQRLVNIMEEGQRSVSPQLFDLQERFNSTIEDFQKQLDLIVKYDWDFDNYLEEDVPAAVR